MTTSVIPPALFEAAAGAALGAGALVWAFAAPHHANANTDALIQMVVFMIPPNALRCALCGEQRGPKLDQAR
ncbi:MAG TPA: hypothetical protein VHZ26_08720 [Caulobacteraceae bacterium]|nr:hypothetical protein [Caulobacteraceae bacterium]